MIKQSKRSNHFIYLAVAAATLTTFSAGGCFSWTSPILPKLDSTDPAINPLSRPITTFEKSWIAAIMNLAAVVGPFVGGVCSEKFGKKKTLLIMGMPMMISHLICAFAFNVYLFFVARLIIGIGVGAIFGVIPAYVADIAEDNNRGVLGSALGVTSSAGGLFMYVIGPFVSIRTFSLINVIPIILFYVLFGCFIPESPYDLIKQGNRKAAEESLMRLRNKISGQIEDELALIIKTFEASKGSEESTLFRIFKNKTFAKGLIISNGLMFFQQMSGTVAVMGYTQYIFQTAGSSILPIYSAMLVGAVQLFSNIASTQLIDRAGRKILLIISLIFLVISLVSLGTYFYLKTSGENVDQISWLPVASLVLFVTAFNTGLANVPWICLSELFPANIKAFTSTITTSFLFCCSFLVTMCFPYLNASIGMAGSFWLFAALLMVGIIFSIILVPETKGKSIQEIQHILEGIPKQTVDCSINKSSGITIGREKENDNF